jgi:hypothetical protein
LLDLARQALSKRELSSLMVISSAVANVVTILRKNFNIDDAEREALANNAYDVAHDFVSL